MVHDQVADKGHKWVLFLDDDVSLAPLSLKMTVERMEAEPDTFMATGVLSPGLGPVVPERALSVSFVRMRTRNKGAREMKN